MAAVLCHDHWSSSWIELTATAAQTSAVIRIFGHDAEMRAQSDGCFGKLGIVVVGSHGPAAGALEDGKHESGNLETTIYLGVIVQGIVIHLDGSRDGSWLGVLHMVGEAVNRSKVRCGIWETLMEGCLDRMSITTSHGNFQVVSPLADAGQASLRPVAVLNAGLAVLLPEVVGVSGQTESLVLDVGDVQSCVSGVGAGRAVGAILMTLVLESLFRRVSII